MYRKMIKFSTYSMIVFFVMILLVLIKAWMSGKFNSVDSFQNYMAGYGVFAPIILTAFQAVQVVIPVLPGFLGCAVGAVMFGSAGSFLCNYIGISAGSIIAFLLARKYGTGLVKELFVAH